MPECLDASTLFPYRRRSASSTLHRHTKQLNAPPLAAANQTLHFEAFNSFSRNGYISRAFSDHTHSARCCWRNVHREVTYEYVVWSRCIANRRQHSAKSRRFNLAHSQLAEAARCSSSWPCTPKRSWWILSEKPQYGIVFVRARTSPSKDNEIIYKSEWDTATVCASVETSRN